MTGWHLNVMFVLCKFSHRVVRKQHPAGGQCCVLFFVFYGFSGDASSQSSGVHLVMMCHSDNNSGRTDCECRNICPFFRCAVSFCGAAGRDGHAHRACRRQPTPTGEGVFMAVATTVAEFSAVSLRLPAQGEIRSGEGGAPRRTLWLLRGSARGFQASSSSRWAARARK